MATVRKTYKTPEAGTPLMTTISSKCKTPLLKIKFANILNPFCYPNSPTVARYSVTCIVDPKKHAEFVAGIQSIEKREGVESILKRETIKDEEQYLFTGNYLIKLQTKVKLPVFEVTKDNKEIEIELEDELAPGEDIIVEYDVLRYTKKNTIETEHGLSFKAKKIYYYAKE